MSKVNRIRIVAVCVGFILVMGGILVMFLGGPFVALWLGVLPGFALLFIVMISQAFF